MYLAPKKEDTLLMAELTAVSLPNASSHSRIVYFLPNAPGLRCDGFSWVEDQWIFVGRGKG